MRVDLGSADNPPEGFDLYVDVVQSPNVPAEKFLQADLRQPWPMKDSSVQLLRAFDLIEHLPDKILTMNEAWRVLAPGGIFWVFVPTTDGAGAWCDPTHVSFWNRASFDYFLDGAPERVRFAASYGIKAGFRMRREERRDRFLTYPSGPISVAHLLLELEAVK